MENHHFLAGKIHYFNSHFPLQTVSSPEANPTSPSCKVLKPPQKRAKCRASSQDDVHIQAMAPDSPETSSPAATKNNPQECHEPGFLWVFSLNRPIGQDQHHLSSSRAWPQVNHLYHTSKKCKAMRTAFCAFLNQFMANQA